MGLLASACLKTDSESIALKVLMMPVLVQIITESSQTKCMQNHSTPAATIMWHRLAIASVDSQIMYLAADNYILHMLTSVDSSYYT